MFKCENVSVHYGAHEAVNEFNYEFNAGQLYFLVGPNGSGKSTILKAMNNLIEYSGDINLDGQSIKEYNHKLKALKIGYIAQMNEIMFPYTIEETVMMGRYPHLKKDYSDYSANDYQVVNKILSELKLDSMRTKLITTCSGGELQRVYIARLLAQETKIILVDEITNHLDIKYQIETMELLRELAHQHDKCVIGVIHDIKMAQEYCDQLLVLNEGRLVYEGSPDKIELSLLSDVYQISENILLPYIKGNK